MGTFAEGCSERSGGVAGGQIGYRWQANQWVFGVEAQGDWADLSRTRVSLFDPTLSLRTKTDGIGLFTGQIGYAWNQVLLYVKGGAAVTNNRFSILDNLNFGAELASASSTRWGGVVGVGFEYGFAPNWSVGLEYDHLFMGDANNTFSIVTPLPLYSTTGSARTWIWSPCASTTAGAARSSRSTDLRFQPTNTEKAGLAPAFLFGFWGSPDRLC